MPRHGSRRKKTRTHKSLTEQEIDSVPKSMVIKRSTLPKELKLLLKNFRSLMYPFTAMKLKESKNMKIKELCKAAHNFGVKNLIMFSSKMGKHYIRFSGTGKGPTFTFRIKSFILNKDLQAHIPRNKILNAEHLGIPLVMCKGFDGQPLQTLSSFQEEKKGKASDLKKYLRVLNAQFKNLFPDLNVNKDADYENCRRVVLFLYNQQKGLFEVRNYYVKKTFSGMNKKIKKLLNDEKLMDFSKVNDVSDLFLANKMEVSDSDVDNLQTKLDVEQKANGEKLKTQVNVRLFEIGPRLTLELLKIEEDFLKGEVLYHSLVSKTDAEKQAQRDKITERGLLREKRRKEQEENVKRKELEKRNHEQFQSGQSEEKEKVDSEEEMVDKFENDFV